MAALALLLLAAAAPVRQAEPPERVRPRLTIQTGHSAGIQLAAFTPDGRHLVTAPGGRAWSEHTEPLLWDARTGRQLRAFQARNHGFATAMAISRDGTWAIVGRESETLTITRLDTGETRRGPNVGWALGVGIAPDGETFVVLTAEGVVRRYRTERMELVQQFDVGDVVQDPGACAVTNDAGLVLALGTEGRLRLWDVVEAEPVAEYAVDLGGAPPGSGIESEAPDEAYGVAVSPIGDWVALGTADGRFFKWAVPEPEPVHAMEMGLDASTLRMSPDGRYALVVGPEGTDTVAWDLEPEGTEGPQELGIVPGTPLVVSPDSRRVLTTPFSDHAELGNNTVNLYDVEDGELLTRFEGLVSPLTDVEVSTDGGLLLAGDIDGTLHLWDLEEGVQIRALGLDERISSVGFDPQMEYAHASLESLAEYWPDDDGSGEVSEDVATTVVLPLHDLLYAPPEEIEVTSAVEGRIAAFLPGGRIATGDAAGAVRVWDLETSELIAELGSGSGRVTSLELSLANGVLAAGFETGAGLAWDLESGAPISRFELGGRVHLDADGGRFAASDGFELTSVGQVGQSRPEHVVPGRVCAIAPGGERLVAASGSSVTLHSEEGGAWREVGEWSRHGDDVVDLEFSADGRFFWSAGFDGVIVLYDAEEPGPVARLASFVDHESEWYGDQAGTWAVLDAEWRYDASGGGEVEGLHWVVGPDIVELAQLKDGYYEPGLLGKILGGDTEELRDVLAIAQTGMALAPEVEILEEPSLISAVLRARIVNKGGGIGPVRVRVNGRTLTEDAREAGADEDARELVVAVDLSQSPHYSPGINEIELVPSAKGAGALQGRGGRVRVQRTDPFSDLASKGREPQSFYAVVAGVSRYAGEDIRLKFASKDARDFSKAVEIAATRLYDEGRVHVQVLEDEGTPATRANLLAALESLTSSTTNDTVLLYLAGHGVSFGDEYFYLTQDAKSLELPQDADARRAVTLSGSELQAWLNKELPALRVVMILDTCQSGQLISDIATARGGDAGRKRALERLKDNTATYLLAGSAADQVSYEATPFGQGLLTYSLLLGMRGEALREEEFVDVQDLFQYAQTRVPKLAKEMRGIQRPLMAMPSKGKASGGGSFDIGRLDEAGRDAIPIAKQRPLVLRTSFELADVPLDTLGLTTKVNAAMRDHSATQDPRFVFVEGDTMSGALRVRGRYTVDGDALELLLYVFAGTKMKTDGPVRIAGKASDLDAVTRRVLSEVASAAK